MGKNQYRKFIEQSPTNAQALSSDVIKTTKMLYDMKCPRNFMRGYISTIKLILEGEDTLGKKTLESNRAEY